MKTYNEEFKLRIVQLFKAGKSVSQLCEEFDLKGQTVYAWIKKYDGSITIKNAPQLSDMEKENIKLKKQLKQQDMELDILKQAAVLIGKR